MSTPKRSVLERRPQGRIRLSVLSRIRKPNSILFLRPDYHCTFAYRSALQTMGWDVAIFSDMNPEDPLLFSSEGVQFKNLVPHWLPSILHFPYRFLRHIYFFLKSLRYEYHILYGRPPFFSFKEESKIFNWATRGLTDRGFLISLSLTRLFGIKMVFRPSGCRDVNLRADFQKLDEGNVCGNCGFFDRCDENSNERNLKRLSRYFSAILGDGSDPMNTIRVKELRWKAIDLKVWRPFQDFLDVSKADGPRKVRILHSHSMGSRLGNGKNIKGTPAIIRAVERLVEEGYPVEIIEVTGVPSREMRHYQASADIIVDQLIYGWWGSTGVEGMALGKPVVCYLRESWKQRFFEVFPDVVNLPVIEASPSTIYDVLRQLVENPELRVQKSLESRQFAEHHFNPIKNALSLQETLSAL